MLPLSLCARRSHSACLQVTVGLPPRRQLEPHESSQQSIDLRNRIVRLDGRNYHQVEPVTSGTRYSVYLVQQLLARGSYTHPSHPIALSRTVA